jgi:hydrogenase maturation protein HypF
MNRRETLLSSEVAPGNPCLGVMLPYTPVHRLLIEALDDIPLVMTSGNQSDEPIAYDDREAIRQLTGLADSFLTHDRPIHLRCDDSVIRVVAGHSLPVRRSRGYAPAPIRLPVRCSKPILALGGQLKATFALGVGEQAILSHHYGDLEYYEAFRSYVEGVAHYQRLFAVAPELIAHDLHPDYATTRYARSLLPSIPRLGVQHHHAHFASCLAENDWSEPAIGVVFDGTGYGTDGAVWGGEFLIGNYLDMTRVAHLRYVPLPGGEQAIREPWRMATAHLLDAGLEPALPAPECTATAIQNVCSMVKRRINAPLTSSVGRLFDAVAAMAGVRTHVEFDGQAAMELEWLAAKGMAQGSYPFEIVRSSSPTVAQSPLQIDTRPLIVALADDLQRGQPRETVARRFHTTLVEIIAMICCRVREETGLKTVALSGGVFMNALLLTETVERLETERFRVHRHKVVPTNDGGLCLGQLAIAAARHSRDNAAGAEGVRSSTHT